jgi:hypothetical protein
MKLLFLVLALLLLIAFLIGCASPGDFPGDRGCEIDPQSCK